jgi:predicted nucleic acid-binding protein
MVIVSDTNILSSLASADALDLLAELFHGDTIYIPPAVEQELQVALSYGQAHVERVFQALEAGDIQRIELTDAERLLMATLPAKLHAGEREGIVICQVRKHLFLSNDRRAVRYCDANGIETISLAFLLRSLWILRILSQHEVRELIKTMGTVEDLVLNKTQRDFIFAPRRPRRRRRRRRKS